MEIPKIECGIARHLSMEGILDALADEGLRPKEIDGGLLRFTRNDKSYLARCFKDEPTLLMLSAPRIYELTDRDDKSLILELLNHINSEAYVAKIHSFEDSIWVTVEVRHQRMGAAAELLIQYIDDIDCVVKMFYDRVWRTGDNHSESLQ